MKITLRHIGKSADDLRFFILCSGRHAGGITVHSVCGTRFSYGIAVVPAMRRRGIARAALTLLFERMRRCGFTEVTVQVAPENAASLALHTGLGFTRAAQDERAVTLFLRL